MIRLFGERSPNCKTSHAEKIDMVGLREAVGNSVRSFMCSAAQANADWSGYISGALSGVPGVGGVASNFGADSDVFVNLFCPQPAPAAPPTYPPRDLGLGQCPAVYEVDWTYRRFNGNGDDLGTASGTTSSILPPGGPIIGPISQPFRVEAPGGGFRIRFDCKTTGGVDAQAQIVGFGTGDAIVEEFTPRRVDGLPDDCGTPGQQPPPTGSDDITYDGPDGNPVDVTINIEPDFPIFSPDGDLNIPIIVGFPTFNLNVNFNVNTGDVNISLGGEPGAEECCPPVEDMPDDDMGEEDDPPPPDDDKRLWGIKVNCQVASPNSSVTVVQRPGTVPLHLPDLGLVRFAVSIGGLRAWTSAQKIQTLSQFLAVNAPATAYAYDIFPRPGVTIAPTEVIVKGTNE